MKVRVFALTTASRDSIELPFELVHAPPGAARSTLADDARRGLSQRPRAIPPKHFYDATGSALFDAICELPEYYLTRTERSLIDTHAAAIATRAAAAEMVELGSGMARKTGVLLLAMKHALAAKHGGSPVYVPFDISRDAIEQAVPALLELVPGLRVRGVVGDFTQDMEALARRPKHQTHVVMGQHAHHASHAAGHAATAAGHRGTAPRRMFALLGSTIGNLDEIEAPALIRTVTDVMGEGDTFLLGADLAKDARVLHAAYNDAAGVTAQFNKNVLTVMNRELGADFDLDGWTHEARYEIERGRIEMHLIANGATRVNVPALGMTIDFEAGESILTEISRKFTRESLEATVRGGGMEIDTWYSDGAFALVLARRARLLRYSSAAM